MPNLKRPVKVKEMLCDALCSLIAEGKPYSDISIQDIVDRAGTCRNSFYRNYDSKDDILKDRFLKVGTESDKMWAEPKDYYGMIYSINMTCKKNRDFLMCFYRANSMMYFDTFVTKILTSNTSAPIDTISPVAYYTYAARAWMAAGILTEWLLRDCDLSVEELTDFIKNTIPV